jgi:hypothetical protein
LYRSAYYKIPIAVLHCFFQDIIFRSNACKASRKCLCRFCFAAYKLDAVKRMPRKRLHQAASHFFRPPSHQENYLSIHASIFLSSIAFHVISFVSPPLRAADTPHFMLSISPMLCASGLMEIITPLLSA